MPHRGDLGLSGTALVAFLLGPLLALLLSRRWRLAAARREEVVRLAFLAAQEATRAEEEAVLAYRPITAATAAGRGLRTPQCAVCYRPTTTRCSRCKAVRYCSGECQIIHWRQGHKDECHPPKDDDYYTGQVTISNLKEVKAQQPDLHNDNLEIDGKSKKEPIVPSPERPSSESNFSSEAFSEGEFADTSGTESSSDSFTANSSSGCSTISGSVKTFNEASASEDPSLLDNASIGEPYSKDPTQQVADLTKVAPEFSSVTSSVHSICCTSNFQQRASNSRAEKVDHKPGVLFSTSIIGSDNCTDVKFSEDAGVCQDALVDSAVAQISGDVGSINFQFSQQGNANWLGEKSHLHISSKLPNQASPCQTISAAEKLSCESAPLEGTVQSDCTVPTALGTVASGQSNDVWLLQSTQLKSQSSSPADHASSTGRVHYVSPHASMKVENAPKVRVKLSENTTVPNGVSDLKTSVRKVVQQLKSSKVSMHHPSGFGSDISRKYKMLFSYDYFIKLYKDCDKVGLRPCGLTNCGNSCYANAVLQSLAFTPPLTAYLLQGLHSKACQRREWCFTCEFESLLMKAKQGQSPLSPTGILSHIHKIGSHLGHGREEDAHEFLRYAIDAMQSVCLKEAQSYAVGPLAEETTLIQLTFGGYLRSKIRCMRCWGKSEQHERMMDLTVEIQGNIGTLEEALRKFTATEILDGENKYHCNRCKSYERAKKKLTMLDAPNILTIALKRFQVNVHKSGKFGKLNKSVRFPEYLDMAPYMSGTNDKSPLYRLYAVVVHLDIMNAAFSGHYVCYVKSTQGKWYKTDDSMVKQVELENVLSKNAYMLFYARCSPRAPSLIRNTICQGQVKSKKSQCKEAVCSEPIREKARSSSEMLHHASSVVQHIGEDHPYSTMNNHFSYEPYNLFHERFLFPKTDSSSDSSSLLSCSDEGSWSTESTRDSTSTDEYSEYIFGESDHYNWNSPLRVSEDSNGYTRSPRNSRHTSEIVSNGHAPDRFKSSILASNTTSSYHEDGRRVYAVKLWSRSASAR